MELIFTTLRIGFIVLTPVWLLNVYLKYIYQFTLVDLVRHFSLVNGDINLPPLIGSSILMVVCTLYFSGIVNGLCLKAFGESHRWVYLGNDSAFNGHYYLKLDI